MHGWAGRNEGGAPITPLRGLWSGRIPVRRYAPLGLAHALALGVLLLAGAAGVRDAQAAVEGTMIDAGDGFACAVGPDGTLACWGDNSLGEASPPAGTFSQVSAGYQHSCAVGTDGTLACWGYNRYGQATPPAGIFSQVSAGYEHSCAVRTNGNLSCWGSNVGYRLSVPQGTFSQVSASQWHSCAVAIDGHIDCWGYDFYGQGSNPPEGSFTQVSTGPQHSCAVRTDRTVACWGENQSGQATPPAGSFSQVSIVGSSATCGLRTDGTLACWGSIGLPPAGTFRQVSGNCAVRTDGARVCWGSSAPATPVTGTFSQASSGRYHSCAVGTDGTLACWGDNYYGQATPPAGTFTQVSARYNHTCAVRTDEAVACWGDNYYGQATPPAGTFTQVSSGDNYSCAVGADGILACWGSNASGQATPPAAGTFLQVSAGTSHTCAVDTNQTIACWGSNTYGQATPPAGTFSQVTAGYYHSCGVRTDGTLACWGYNEDGQATPPTGTFSQVSAGSSWNNHETCAVRVDGTLACWGSNAYGQATPPAGIFNSVSAGHDYNCAVRDDGFLVCWGGGGNGPLALAPSSGLPDATVGVAYAERFQGSGGIPPYSYTVVGGSLPPGLTLGTDGLLTGRPTELGSYAFTVRVADALPYPLVTEIAYTLDTVEPLVPIAKIGTWRPSTRRFYLDSNGNGRWEGTAGGDTLTAAFGLSTDLPVTGDWTGDGTDRVGAWRPSTRRFLLDSNGNGKWDGAAGGDTLTGAFGLSTDLPVTGDWNGDGRDDMGVWRPSTRRFLLDSNGNGKWDGAAGGDLTAAFGVSTDLPVAGDWNGDGTDDIGVWRPSLGKFLLDSNGSYTWDGAAGGDTLTAAYGVSTDLPVTGDWNGDGNDEIGVWRPSLRKFLLDSNANGIWDGTAGADALSAPFGLATDLPVAGRW